MSELISQVNNVYKQALVKNQVEEEAFIRFRLNILVLSAALRPSGRLFQWLGALKLKSADLF